MKRQDFIAELEELVKLNIVSKQEFYDHYDKGHYTVFVLELCSFSDYSGSCVERANNKHFVEKYSFVNEEYGGYGTVWTIIDPDELPNKSEKYNEFLEEYKSLLEYPVISDILLTDIETEAEIEAWENWARDDFISLLDKKFEYDLDEYDCIDLEEYFEKHCEKNDIDIDFNEFILSLFEKMQGNYNEYWIIETGGSAWIDLEKIVNNITWQDIISHLEKIS